MRDDASRLTTLIEDARHRMAREALDGARWTFHRVMTKADRDTFDWWLVSINHVLANEPGTQERRFLSFMSDLTSGRYKGQLP
jgi:hypothetical protein